MKPLTKIMLAGALLAWMVKKDRRRDAPGARAALDAADAAAGTRSPGIGADSPNTAERLGHAHNAGAGSAPPLPEPAETAGEPIRPGLPDFARGA